MCIVRLIACAFLTLVIFFSEAWAGNTQIESYSALKSALGQGEVPVNGLIDMEQCQYKWPLSLNSRGKKMIVFKQNTINEDGSIVMLTSYKVSMHLMAELKLANPPPEWVEQDWIEGQSAFTLSGEDDRQFKIKFIATDTNTGAILSAGQYRCQLGSAVKLWRTPHGHQGVGSFYGYWVLSSVISLIGGWLAGVFTTGFSASSIR